MHYGPKVTQSNMDFCIDIGNPKSGSNATDMVTGKTVTLNNSPTYNSNGFMTFDGVNESIQIAHESYPATFADPFSLECWLYYDSSLTWANAYRGSILCRGNYDGSHGIWRFPTTGVVSAWVRVRASNNAVTTKERTVTLTDNAWNHVMMTWENDVLMAIYKNGELGQSFDPGDVNAAGSLYNADQNDWILCGKNAASGAQSTHFEGDMAMARLYKRALSAAEVKENFEATRGRFGV